MDQALQDQISAYAFATIDITFEDLSGQSTERVDAAISNGDIDLTLEPGPTLVGDQETDFEIAGPLYAALQQLDVVVRGRALGLDPGQIADLLTPVELQERFVDEPDDAEGVINALALIGLIAAFILPQAFGQLTLLSVVEEKSTRVIEVLLSHLRPRTLLVGKVIGVGTLAVAQLLVIVAGLVGALLLTDAIEIPASVWRFVPIIVVSILGGLAVYNTFFALLGPLISRQEDASQVMLPVFAPLMAGYLVGQAAIFGNAASPVVRVLSIFPLTSPMLFPVRVVRDAIEPWEVALSISLLVPTTWLLIRVAGRVYEFTLLHTGSRVTWRQLLRLRRVALVE